MNDSLQPLANDPSARPAGGAPATGEACHGDPAAHAVASVAVWREPSESAAPALVCRGVWVMLAAIGVAALAVATALVVARGDQLGRLLRGYLTAYAFFASISLGALFFVLLQHVTRAGWSVVVRRPAELLAANFPVLIVLFLPILAAAVGPSLGERDTGPAPARLYPWSDPATVEHHELLRHKEPYLNPRAFALRAAVYLAVWWALGAYYLRRSLEQDRSGDPALTLRMERLGPAALLLLGGTMTFAAFDWLMSLEPEWFSTIYGLYFCAGALVGALAALILAVAGLQLAGRLRRCVTAEHYHDLGKLLLAFVVFWGYMAFSQYLLIWYANIPEETVWYLRRQQGGWALLAVILLFGNLLIPFCGLLSRGAKRRRGFLVFWAAWLLVFHWLDLYYLVMPSAGLAHRSPGAVEAGGMVAGVAIDACCLLGVGALYAAAVVRRAGGKAMLPLGDPRLGESLRFENA